MNNYFIDNIPYSHYFVKHKFIQIIWFGISHNVSVVYDVFAVAIKKREAFQQPQKCAGMRRGRRSRPSRMEAEGL